jgi:DNA modification methylase
MGTGTTNVAAAKWGRNSIGVELDSYYYDLTLQRMRSQKEDLFADIEIKTYND